MTLTLPPRVSAGTLVAMLLVLVEVMMGERMLKTTFSLVLSVWKLLPEIVSAVPAVPIVGAKLVMVGA